VTPLVTAAVLCAAVTHASWNAIAHKITDKLVGFTLIAGGGTLIGLVMVPFVAIPAAGAWPYLLASAVIHVVYYMLLMKSFRLGDFGQEYPIARGSAPLVVRRPPGPEQEDLPGGEAVSRKHINRPSVGRVPEADQTTSARQCRRNSCRPTTALPTRPCTFQDREATTLLVRAAAEGIVL